MKRSSGFATVPDVSDTTAEAVEAFARHLRAERGRSEHTARAYLGDVRSLLGFLETECGVQELSDISLRELICIVPLVVLSVLLGVLPHQSLLAWMEPSVTGLVESLAQLTR